MSDGLSYLSAIKPGPVPTSLAASEEEEINLFQRLLTEIKSWKNNPASYRPVHWFLYNNHVTSVLQGLHNPVCGLVGLEMAAELLRRSDSTMPVFSTNQILDHAVDMGITKHGEIFSAYDLCILATSLFNCKATVIDSNLKSKHKLLLETILSGLPVLLAYDSDRNFSPCLNKGHSAHWALVTGFVIRNTDFIPTDISEKLEIGENVLHKLNKGSAILPHLLENALSHTYVYVKQGKSLKSRLWPLQLLLNSNANLIEKDPKKNWENYFCPYNLEHTLANRFIVLSP
uniref:Actin maturation protease n=1 Tax=Ciona intestinalis TaxID=7719 RepID=F6Y3M3_CIOIN|nr:UPF0692 protein C19orf54 homolog [Ciona intestinalis]|eukprot:XP_002130113.1 UPF0692 protein C19orf54 homolog [Ciona intestinalis]